MKSQFTIGIFGIIFDEQKRVLLCHRRDYDLWNLPGDDFLEWKQFFQKIGSNPEIKDKTVHIHWGELWEFTASAVGGKGFEKFDSAILASAKSLLILENEKVSSGDPTENRTLITALRRRCPNR